MQMHIRDISIIHFTVNENREPSLKFREFKIKTAKLNKSECYRQKETLKYVLFRITLLHDWLKLTKAMAKSCQEGKVCL